MALTKDIISCDCKAVASKEIIGGDEFDFNNCTCRMYEEDKLKQKNTPLLVVRIKK